MIHMMVMHGVVAEKRLSSEKFFNLFGYRSEPLPLTKQEDLKMKKKKRHGVDGNFFKGIGPKKAKTYIQMIF